MRFCCWGCILCITLALAGCAPRAFSQQSPSPVPINPRNPAVTTISIQPYSTETPRPTPLPTSPPTFLPLPIDVPGQIVQNNHFDSNARFWDVRLGEVTHTNTVYYYRPGAVLLTASEQDARGDYFALFGQCVDLGDSRIDWQAVDGLYRMTLAVYIKMNTNATGVSLGATLHTAPRCDGNGPVAAFTHTISGAQGWTLLQVTDQIPPEVVSIDILIYVHGISPDASAVIDDVSAHPTVPSQ